jgi:NAD(P)-dependent dehydrogenase (short-subunit alcohol dehydrogenase family)
MAGKVWFITGTSKGFGRVWAEAALARGDRVAATARDVKSLAPLVERYAEKVATIRLDVTDKSAVAAAIKEAHARFGRLDVVINNAGYGLFGAIEEISEAEARAQLETNLFGALWATQAALPIMRAQRSGHIIQVSSIGGVNAFPTVGLYHASKWALEGFSQSLAVEVANLGIKVTLVEPGGYATDWGGASSQRATPIPAYDGARAAIAAFRSGNVPGDPEATGAAILKVVDAADPPLRIFFGSGDCP